MLKRLLIALLACATLAPAFAADSADAIWDKLKTGSYIVLIRHAATVPGTGDPAGFQLGDCSTQRNLSSQGRADARRIGAAFQSRGIPIDGVQSSQWCRCIDTAQLAFGHDQAVPMLNSTFTEDAPTEAAKVRAVFAALNQTRGAGNVILVTHEVNIEALSGVSPYSGEIVVLELDGPARLKLVGRIRVPESESP